MRLLLRPKAASSVSTPITPLLPLARSFSNVLSVNLAAHMPIQRRAPVISGGVYVSDQRQHFDVAHPSHNWPDNLRYTLSACMFGFPVQIVSPSTPCQVTCTPLSPGIESGLGINSSTTDLSFCNVPNFNPGNIQQCVFCYGLLDEQKYLANCTP